MENLPLVTCIMPTRSRPEFARMAVEYWQAQTYPNKELLILDDGDDPSFAGLTPPAGVTLTVTAGTLRYSIPEKLNMLCGMANGEIIARFDDDDYSAPGRLDDQVPRLLDSGKAVSGYHSMLFVTDSGVCKRYVAQRNADALGTSLCFLKSFWKQTPFNVKKLRGSDTRFVGEAREVSKLVSVDAGSLMFARVHSANHCGDHFSAPEFKKVTEEECAFALEVEATRKMLTYASI